MKRAVPESATTMSVLSGHVIFVSPESSVSVMLTKPNKWRSLYVPIPHPYTFETVITEGTFGQKIKGEDLGLS